MGPDKTPAEPQHGAYDDDLHGLDLSSLEPDYEAEERDEDEDIPDEGEGAS
ncbi:MAG TPA: hypothetical protein VFI44_10290 [Ornithinibacter sp.]|nr:hypothetical protein [Ornithinibacter sp.]